MGCCVAKSSRNNKVALPRRPNTGNSDLKHSLLESDQSSVVGVSMTEGDFTKSELMGAYQSPPAVPARTAEAQRVPTRRSLGGGDARLAPGPSQVEPQNQGLRTEDAHSKRMPVVVGEKLLKCDYENKSDWFKKRGQMVRKDFFI
jgi:hypothetical protein